MTDSSDAESPTHQERDAYRAEVWDIIPRHVVIEHYTVLDMIAHHVLFTLRNDTIVYRIEGNLGISDADFDQLVNTAIETKLVEVVWDDAAGTAIGEDGARTAYPLQLTPLGVQVHDFLGRHLRSR